MTELIWQNAIDIYYPADREVRGILISHSHSVAKLAVDLARKRELLLDEVEIINAAMLHDIGIICTDAPGIDCHGSQPYLCHGAIGADMLRSLNIDEKYARVAERHTGTGLTQEEIKKFGIPLPEGRSYMPQTLLEKLICYADCFYSKSGDMKRKSRERIIKGLEKFGPEVLSRFYEMEELFN